MRDGMESDGSKLKFKKAWIKSMLTRISQTDSEFSQVPQ